MNLQLIKKGLSVGLIVLVGGVIGFLFYVHIFLGLTLTDQPGQIRFPPEMTAKVTATRPLAIQLKGIIDAQVPFKQTVQLPLHGTYQANLVLNTHVPLQFVIHYQGVVPIHAKTVVHTTTDLVVHSALLPKFPLTLPIPLDFKQPVTLTVPVNTQLHLIYRGPISVTFNQTIAAPIDTVLHTHLKVDREVQAPILASFGLKVYPPQTPQSLIVKHADLRLPLGGLRFERERDVPDAASQQKINDGVKP